MGKNTRSSKRRRSPSPVKKQHSPRKTRGHRAAEAKDAQNNMENFESLPTLWASPTRKDNMRDDTDVTESSSRKRKSHSGSKSPRRTRSPVKKSSSKSKT